MNKKLILIVEDSSSDIGLMKRIIKKENIINPVIFLDNGNEAINFLFDSELSNEADSERLPAMIVLDLKLPEIGGLEILKQIRKNPNTANIPVVIFSSSREEQDIESCYQFGANSYVRKPIEFDQFTETFTNICTYWLRYNETLK